MDNGDRFSGQEGVVTTLSVFDLNMACAYYANVFEAEISEAATRDRRDMKIGDKRFVLQLEKSGPPPHDPYLAEVADADVCVARCATNGGVIVDAVSSGPDSRRSGAIRDPFGLIWRVANRR